MSPSPPPKSTIVPFQSPLQTIDEHRLEALTVAQRYGTNLAKDAPFKSLGLQDQNAVLANRTKFGANTLVEYKKPSYLLQYFLYLRNLFSVMLFISGTLTLVVYILDPTNYVNLYVGIIFYAVAFFNAGLEFYQSYKSQQVLAAFKTMVSPMATVIRNGTFVAIPSSEVVCGDLLFCKAGDKISADCRIVSSTAVKVDNSSLTGESEPVDRQNVDKCEDSAADAINLLFAGTIMVSGEALAIVIRVGNYSVVGKIMELATKEKDVQSPLETELDVSIRRIVCTAIIVGLLFLGAAFIEGEGVITALDAAVGIFVAFLPQGLPATITILLTVAAKRMAKRNVLVKDLRAVETLGSMTVLASDKTGTLTQNKMAVDGIWINMNSISRPFMVDVKDKVPNFVGHLVANGALCSRSKFDENQRGMPIRDRTIIGDATEVGILKFCGEYIDDLQAFQDAHPKMFEIPFNSDNKWQLSIHQFPHQHGSLTAFIKGAPDQIIHVCTTYMKGTETKAVNGEFMDQFSAAYKDFASKGDRLIAFAEKALDANIYPLEEYDFDQFMPTLDQDKFTFVGFLALIDPPKSGVAESILTIKKAGIKLFMVTGDHPLTAQAIGRLVNILTFPTQTIITSKADLDSYYQAISSPITTTAIITSSNTNAAAASQASLIVHGDIIDSFGPMDWDTILAAKEIVFARTLPRHKLGIVRNLQRLGHVVGMCGDGINDSPALKTADLGISMNRTGSDVSKDAAALILLDDNFTSITAGIYEGRYIFENLKKSIRYTMTHITPEVLGLVTFVLFQIPPPITPLLILMIDVGSEIGPALSFAREPAEIDLMVLPPRKKPCKQIDPKVDPTNSFIHKYTQWCKKIRKQITHPFIIPFCGERLIDTELTIWVYFQGGIILSLGTFGAYLIVFGMRRVPFSLLWRGAETYFQTDSPPMLLGNGEIALASEQVQILNEAQGAYYLAIVIGQWFNLFCTKHRYRYPYGRDMLSNKWTYVGILSSAIVGVLVCYVPVLSTDVFHTYEPTPVALAAPVVAGAILFAYEFLRKFIINSRVKVQL